MLFSWGMYGIISVFWPRTLIHDEEHRKEWTE